MFNRVPAALLGVAIVTATSAVLLRQSVAGAQSGTSVHEAAPDKAWKPKFTPTPLRQADIPVRQRDLLADALQALPADCQWSLKNIYVKTRKEIERGMAGSESIILNGDVSDDELRAVFIHEFGHITDLGCLRGSEAAGASAFKDGSHAIYNDDPSIGFYAISWKDATTKRQGARKEDFISGYASWDPFEEFAETFAYYVLQQDAFRARAKKNDVLRRKLEWFEANVFRNYDPPANGRTTGKEKQPWDVTLLPYDWQPVTVALGR